MDITRITTLEDNIDNDLWPELILAITYVINNRPIRVLYDLSSYKLYTYELLDLAHL